MSFFKITFISIIIFGDYLFGCATCFGDPNSSASQGMNWAIISLLITTGGVLSGISLSIIKIAKKSKHYNQIKRM
tara:strand:- start:523 stop:747 length:225 start_codon:yes stop_codon:yes gene_type:complete